VVPAARVAWVVPEVPVVPVALELALAQAAVPEPERGPVVELEQVHGQAEGLALLIAQAAVPLKTKSVIATHRLGLVLLLEAGEDLAAAVAETTREPAAAEAVIAWEVADTVAAVVAAVVAVVAAVVAAVAAVVAAVAVVVAAVAEEDAEDKRNRR